MEPLLSHDGHVEVVHQGQLQPLAPLVVVGVVEGLDIEEHRVAVILAGLRALHIDVELNKQEFYTARIVNWPCLIKANWIVPSSRQCSQLRPIVFVVLAARPRVRSWTTLSVQCRHSQKRLEKSEPHQSNSRKNFRKMAAVLLRKCHFFNIGYCKYKDKGCQHKHPDECCDFQRLSKQTPNALKPENFLKFNAVNIYIKKTQSDNTTNDAVAENIYVDI